MIEPISKEVKEALAWVKAWMASLTGSPSTILANWGLHERAMRLKAEWRYEHGKQEDSCLIASGYGMENCGTAERHCWTDAQWEQSVEEEMKI